MTFGELFAGSGGFSLGFEAAGMTCRFQVEIDATARAVLARHWPDVPRFDDVRNCHSQGYLDASVRSFFAPTGSDYTQKELTVAGKLKKLTPMQAEECVRMYERGLSLAPIAEYFAVSRQAMWDLLRRRTTMRPQKRYGKDNHFHRGGVRADDQSHNLVEAAIADGVLIRAGGCEECGDSGCFADGRNKVQAHHDDYNKPLDVRWLCQKCHHEWHKHNTAKRKEVLEELAAVDVLVGGFP